MQDVNWFGIAFGSFLAAIYWASSMPDDFSTPMFFMVLIAGMAFPHFIKGPV